MAGAAESISLDVLAKWAGRTSVDLTKLTFEKPLKQCKVLLAADMKSNFARQSSPAGVPWAPLKHPRPRGGSQILRDRGLLMASLTAQGRGHVERLNARELVMGTNLEYAGLHQYGGTIRPKRGKYLAIPLTREAVTAGSPRRMDGLVGIFGAKGGVLKKGDVVHFALTKSVTVPARPFVGVSAKAQATIPKIFGDFIMGVAAKG